MIISQSRVMRTCRSCFIVVDSFPRLGHLSCWRSWLMSYLTRGSNRNTHTIGTVAGSSSRPVGVSSSVPVNKPLVESVASPSFAVDLNCSGGREVGVGDIMPTSSQCAAPVGLGNALLDDVDDDDVEPDIIADDSGDDIGASQPAKAGGGSSSGTQ
ncbi:Putative mutator sub-class protein [Arachis hypogaea]|nr:Putative mutator sub-class protein [Arachis hypogaea]